MNLSIPKLIINFILNFLCILSFTAFAQTGTLTGQVINKENQNPLGFANIELTHLNRGTTTDSLGYFEFFRIPAGKHKLSVQYMGFATRVVSIVVTANETNKLTIALSPKTIPLKSVMVTSTKYMKKLEDVSLPLGLVRSEDIDHYAPLTISDILRTEPGLSMTRDGMWGTYVNIRGLSKTNIVLLVDGNRLDTTSDLAAGLSLVSIHDIERIEVVKGAASALYGSGAIGGAVNIITKEGQYKNQFYTNARITSGYRSMNNAGSGSMTLTAGDYHWNAQVSGLLRDAANAETPRGTLENSQFSDDNISARLGVRINPKHEFKFNFQRYRAHDVGIPGGYPVFPENADVRYPTEKRDMASLQYIARNLTPNLGKLSAKYFIQNILRDVENIPNIVKSIPAQNGQPGKEIHVQSVKPQGDHDTRGFQLQADWNLSDHHFLVTGVDVWRKDLVGFRTRNMKINVINPSTGDVANTLYQTIAERSLPESFYTSAGVYMSDEIQLMQNRAVLSLGGRYDHIRIENEKALDPLYTIVNGVRNDTPPNQQVLWQATSATNQSWSTNVGLLYHAHSDIDLTLNIGRSFRSPYLEERFLYVDLGNLIKIGDPYLESEQGWFTDIGMRIWKSGFTFMGNLYLNQLSNMVVDMPGQYDGRQALIKSNVGKARLLGFDLKANYALLNSMSIYIQAAFTNGQNTIDNEPLPGIPPLNGKLGLKGFMTNWLGFDVRASIYDNQDRIVEYEFKTPGYSTFDAYFYTQSFRLGAFSHKFIFGIENITNKAYRSHLATNRGLIRIEPGRDFILNWQMEFK